MLLTFLAVPCIFMLEKETPTSSYSKRFEVQPVECITHLFSIAMSISKIMVI